MGRWGGTAVLQGGIEEDEMNVVHAQLTHVTWVLMRMAGTVEVPDCGALACTHSCLTLCLTPCPCHPCALIQCPTYMQDIHPCP